MRFTRYSYATIAYQTSNDILQLDLNACLICNQFVWQDEYITQCSHMMTHHFTREQYHVSRCDIESFFAISQNGSDFSLVHPSQSQMQLVMSYRWNMPRGYTLLLWHIWFMNIRNIWQKFLFAPSKKSHCCIFYTDAATFIVCTFRLKFHFKLISFTNGVQFFVRNGKKRAENIQQSNRNATINLSKWSTVYL